MFVGYAFYYLSRKSLTTVMPVLIADLGMSKASLGFLGTAFSLTYGLSKFVSGIMSDRSNPRYFMAFGLMITGFANIFFGFSSTVSAFALFWGINGWFQGFGWPPCAKLLTHWYAQSERGAWWSTFNVSHNVGAFATPYIVTVVVWYLGWRYAMYVPGLLCIMMSFVLLNRLRSTPESMDLPSVENWISEESKPEDTEVDEDRKLSTKELLFNIVLKNPYVWLLAFSYFFVYFVRTAVGEWTALYLIESKSYTLMGANSCVSLFEVGGFVGCLAAGWASDKLFRAERGPILVLFSIGMLLSSVGFYMNPEGFWLGDCIAMFAMGFFVFGPQMMIGMAAAEYTHINAAATATGFVGWFAYAGAAIAGYPLGRIAEDYGWIGYNISMGACCLVALLLMVPLWRVKSRDVREKLLK